MTITVPLWLLYLVGAVIGIPLVIIIFALAYVGYLSLSGFKIRW